MSFTFIRSLGAGGLVASLLESRCDKLAKVRRSPSSNGIPAYFGWKSGRVTTITGAVGYVGKCLVTSAVDPWVEESERCLAFCNESIVDEGDDCREGRAATLLALSSPQTSY